METKTRYEWDKERLQMYLRQLRACAGLSADDVAEQLDVSKQAISFLENNLDKPMNRMHYIAIRSVIEEEYMKQPGNINLRDCYDLVFSDPEFYQKNIKKIEYAIDLAVEDVKKAKKERKKDTKAIIAMGAATGGIVGAAAGAALIGTTIATAGIGGIATLMFPYGFALGRSISDLTNELEMYKKKKKMQKGTDMERPSDSIHHKQWLEDAFEAKRTK